LSEIDKKTEKLEERLMNDEIETATYKNESNDTLKKEQCFPMTSNEHNKEIMRPNGRSFSSFCRS